MPDALKFGNTNTHGLRSSAFIWPNPFDFPNPYIRKNPIIMHIVIPPSILWSLLVLNVSARPSGIDGPSGIGGLSPRAVSVIPDNLQNDMDPVWGPNDFGCDVVSYGSPFNQPLDSYMFVVNFLSQ